MKKALYCFGTRPETIKMARLIQESNKFGFEPIVCLSGQHREMLNPFVKFFELPTQFNLDIMTANQTLADITAKVVTGVSEVIKKVNPDVLLIQGDTTTTFAGALAAFYNKVPVAHIEAGLRTFDKNSPFPEEANRQMTSAISDFHFAPTEISKQNLISQGYSKNIYVTGNTSIDALDYTLSRVGDQSARFPQIDFSKKIFLVTCHRRENFGAPLQRIFKTLLQIKKKYNDVEIVFPVHLNPNVKEEAHNLFSGIEGIHLLAPLEYFDFVWFMKKSYLILSDSGGVQEEAPHLGVPVIVLRENTERPEGVNAGVSFLAGSDEAKIMSFVDNFMDIKFRQEFTKKENPYGDGKASERSLQILKDHLS